MKCFYLTLLLEVFVSYVLSSSINTITQEVVQIMHDLGINYNKTNQDLTNGMQLLKALDTEKSVEASVKRGVLGLRTGLTEYVSFFRGNETCRRKAFNETVQTIYLGAATYAVCANKYPTVPVNETAEQVTMYGLFKGCFQEIFGTVQQTGLRGCSDNFWTSMRNYFSARVKGNPLIPVGKCADEVMLATLRNITVILTKYKVCRDMNSSIVTLSKAAEGTTQASTEASVASTKVSTQATTKVPTQATAEAIEDSVIKFQQYYTARVDRLQLIFEKSVADVHNILTDVNSNYLIANVTAIKDTNTKIRLLMQVLTSHESSSKKKSCNREAIAELDSALAIVQANIQSCNSEATKKLTMLLDDASAIVAGVNAQVSTNGTSAIRNCVTRPGEDVKNCTELVVSNFKQYLDKSFKQIDQSITIVSKAETARKQVKQCVETGSAEFIQKASAAFIAFTSCSAIRS